MYSGAGKIWKIFQISAKSVCNLVARVAPATAENVSFFVKIWKWQINIKIPLFDNNGIFSLVN